MSHEPDRCTTMDLKSFRPRQLSLMLLPSTKNYTAQRGGGEERTSAVAVCLRNRGRDKRCCCMFATQGDPALDVDVVVRLRHNAPPPYSNHTRKYEGSVVYAALPL